MININIILSPDKDIIDDFTYYQNSIILGSASTSNLVISDPDLDREHLLLEAKDTGLFCKNVQEGKFYISNGKKISGGKIHYPGDQITIGKTKIKIINFAKTDNNFKNKLRKCYEEIDIMNPEIQQVLTELEMELIRIVGNLNVSK